MKTLNLLAALLFSTTIAFAQTDLSKAFSESYTLEYNKEYGKAIATLEKVYAADSYELNLRLGWLEYINGQYTKSQDYYKKAIAISSSSVEALFGYAFPTAALAQWDDIIKTYNKVLSIDATNYIANYRLAHIYYSRKDMANAKKYALEANKQYPFDYYINLLLGKINIANGDKVAAKTYISNAYNYDPTVKEVVELLKTL